MESTELLRAIGRPTEGAFDKQVDFAGRLRAPSGKTALGGKEAMAPGWLSRRKEPGVRSLENFGRLGGRPEQPIRMGGSIALDFNETQAI